MNERESRQDLEPPYEDFYISWWENHPQAAPKRWRAGIIWKLGPYGSRIDGDTKEEILPQVFDHIEAVFPNGKRRKR